MRVNKTDGIGSVKEYISEHELCVRGRKPYKVAKKQYLCAYIRYMWGLPYKEIQSMLNYKNHASVIHAIRTHHNMVEVKDPSYSLHTTSLSVMFPFDKLSLPAVTHLKLRLMLSKYDTDTLNRYRSSIGGDVSVEDVLIGFVTERLAKIKEEYGAEDMFVSEAVNIIKNRNNDR